MNYGMTIGSSIYSGSDIKGATAIRTNQYWLTWSTNGDSVHWIIPPRDPAWSLDDDFFTFRISDYETNYVPGGVKIEKNYSFNAIKITGYEHIERHAAILTITWFKRNCSCSSSYGLLLRNSLGEAAVSDTNPTMHIVEKGTLNKVQTKVLHYFQSPTVGVTDVLFIKLPDGGFVSKFTPVSYLTDYFFSPGLDVCSNLTSLEYVIGRNYNLCNPVLPDYGVAVYGPNGTDVYYSNLVDTLPSNGASYKIEGQFSGINQTSNTMTLFSGEAGGSSSNIYVSMSSMPYNTGSTIAGPDFQYRSFVTHCGVKNTTGVSSSENRLGAYKDNLVALNLGPKSETIITVIRDS
jgi:hypothetical protein